MNASFLGADGLSGDTYPPRQRVLGQAGRVPVLPDDRERADYHTHLRAVIDAVRLLGLSTVNTFVGRDPACSIDDNWPLFREVWPPLVLQRDFMVG